MGVSILPGNSRTPWDLIGQMTGQIISQNLPGAIQQGYQRQLGLNAIDQLQNEIKNANGDISKILPAIAKAYTLNPNLERSGLAEQALMRAKTTKGTGAINELIGQGQQQRAPLPNFLNQNQPAQPPQNAPQGLEQATGRNLEMPSQKKEGIFLNKFLPLDLGKIITPEQKAETLDEVARNGGDVNFTRQLIDDYNQGKINQNELANSNVEKQAANTQRMLGFEDEIRKRIDKFVPQNTPEAEKNIYYNMLRPELEKSESFADAWQNVSEKIDNFRKLNEAYIKNIPEVEPTIGGLSKNQERIQRESAKPILKVDPLAYNILEQAYMQKGHSPITVSKTLKPNPEFVEKSLSKAGDYNELIYPKGSFFHEISENEMMRNLEEANKNQLNDISKIVPILRKSWNDDISLLNLYADLKKKAWSLSNITTLMDDLKDKFTPRQQAERAMLNQNMKVPPRYLWVQE